MKRCVWCVECTLPGIYRLKFHGVTQSSGFTLSLEYKCYPFDLLLFLLFLVFQVAQYKHKGWFKTILQQQTISATSRPLTLLDNEILENRIVRKANIDKSKSNVRTNDVQSLGLFFIAETKQIHGVIICPTSKVLSEYTPLPQKSLGFTENLIHFKSLSHPLWISYSFIIYFNQMSNNQNHSHSLTTWSFSHSQGTCQSFLDLKYCSKILKYR